MGFTIYSNVNQASDDLTQKISQSIYQHEIIEESSKKILEILSFMEMSDKIPTTVESQAWAEKRKEILQHSLLETFSPEELNKINSLVQSSFFQELYRSLVSGDIFDQCTMQIFESSQHWIENQEFPEIDATEIKTEANIFVTQLNIDKTIETINFHQLLKEMAEELNITTEETQLNDSFKSYAKKLLRHIISTQITPDDLNKVNEICQDEILKRFFEILVQVDSI